MLSKRFAIKHMYKELRIKKISEMFFSPSQLFEYADM